MIRKKPKPHDHDDVKQHYYEHENESLDDEEIIEKMIKNSKKISKNTQK